MRTGKDILLAMRTSSPQTFRILVNLSTATLLLVAVGCAESDGGGKYSHYKAASKADPAVTSEKQIVAATKTGTPATAPATAPATKTNAGQNGNSVVARAAIPASVGSPGAGLQAAVDLRRQIVVASFIVGPVGGWLVEASANGATSQSVLVAPREIKLLVKDRKFLVEGPEEAIRVNYDDINLLKVLNMEPVPEDAPKQMPGWMKNLEGKRIRIRGFMSPSFKARGLEAFLMGRDNQVCCFPGNAKVYDLFPVKMRNGVTTDFILNRPFDVVGVFHIKPWCEDGEWIRIYEITDAVIVQ